MTSPSLAVILITGGAGYIGSHAALYLVQKGYKVIVLDDLLQGQSFPHTWATFIKGDMADKELLHNLFTDYNVQAVMHFAAFIEVGESVQNPLKFYQNNVAKTLTLLETMLAHNVRNFIFSSSAAVYGMPERVPLIEDHPKNPISPYGQSKLMIELALHDLAKIGALNFVALRYFNAAGALPEFGLGEQHTPETHLIPLLFKAAQTGAPFKIFGSDYPTKDGSCIRDYLHVWDIADAHWRALEHILHDKPSDCFNLGTGCGISVKQMIEAIEKVCQTKITTTFEKRRPGDPAILVADAAKAATILQWKPQFSDLDFILHSAYAFAYGTRLTAQQIQL